MSAEIQLRSGRHIQLKEFTQKAYYEGLLEGLPTVEKNRESLASFVSQVKEQYDWCNVLLIPPDETLLEDDAESPYPFGTPATLPAVACIARFSSYKVARDKNMDYSQLVVIWFQHDFTFSLADEALQQVQALDWEQHATDLEY